MNINIQKILTFKFKPDKYTYIAIILGVISVFLSIYLKNFSSLLGKFFIRDFLQISVVGIIIPFIIISKAKFSFSELGLRFDNAHKYILTSMFLGFLFSFFFTKGDPNKLNALLQTKNIGPALYVMTANIYEVIFFFIFLRFYFEKAFGILPSIGLAAIFYSLHHAGFQPQFIKLFIVGLVFISIFRITNHWLICFPLWWVGGVCDVIIMSPDVTRPAGINGWRCLPVLIIIVAMFYLKYPFKVNNKIITNGEAKVNCTKYSKAGFWL